MKKSLLAIGALCALTLIAIPVVRAIRTTSAPIEVPADQRHERELSEKHRERIARRKARQAAYEHFIDSTVLSHNFIFYPSMFNVEPAGGSNLINNPNAELAIYSDWADICLPYYRGFTPPYRLAVVNTVITTLNGYTAVQTNDGWNVTFNSWLYSGNEYTFTLQIYSSSGSAQLQLSSDFYPTTTYWGSISAVR